MTYETLYSILYLQINLFAVILLLMILAKTLGLSKMIAQRIFSMAVDSTIVLFVSDTAWVLTENGFLPHSAWSILFFKDIYFLATSAMCFFWFVYFEYLQDSPFVKNTRRMRISSAFVWVQAVIIVINHFAGFLYSVDSAGVYHRGPAFALLYVFSYVYVIITCTRALIGVFKKENEHKKKLLLRLAFFPVAPAIAGMVQFKLPSVPLLSSTMALMTLLMYMDSMDEMISIDPLTRLNNRKQAAFHYEQLCKNNDDHIPIYLILFDANKFKSINDTYGHVEGDAALIRVADSLRKGCGILKRRANIARFGGDEFLIMVKAENDRIIDELIAEIRRNLAVLNEEANAPYELTVSVGIAKTDGYAATPLKALAEEADKKLYEDKKKGSENQ